MRPTVPYFALLGDLAANFLALTLLLAVLVQSNGGPPLTERAAAQQTPGFHRQKPLGGAEAVAFLFDRRADAPGSTIDVSDHGVVVAVAGREDTIPCSRSLTLPAVAPVRLALFAPGCLEPVLAALRSGGLEPRILTVPAALRSAGGDGWSNEFRRLIASSDRADRFAADLARLLSHATALRSGGGVARGGEGDAGGAMAGAAGTNDATSAARPLALRILSWLEGPLTGLALLPAAVVLWLIERRRSATLSALARRSPRVT